MSISKGFRYKDKEGKVTDYEYGVNGSNVTQDANHRLVTDEEKKTWNGKADPEDIPSGSAASYSVANNDTTTQAGFVADARIVKQHGDEIDQLSQDLGALNSKGNAELLVSGTTTGIKTVPNLSQYRFLACYMVGNIGYMADLIIPVSLFKTLDNSVTSKRIRVIHGTEYYYDACYVTDTSINILAINNAPYYIYGIK